MADKTLPVNFQMAPVPGIFPGFVADQLESINTTDEIKSQIQIDHWLKVTEKY